MPFQSSKPRRTGALRSSLLAVRRRRRLQIGQVASRMGMARRSYEYFEASSRIDLDRLERFAVATDSDPYALLLSVPLDDPGFAARCADHRLATILLQHLGALNAELGDDLAKLEPAGIEAVIGRAVQELASMARGDPSEP